MNFSIAFIRIFFVLMSLFFFTAYSVSVAADDNSAIAMIYGLLGGALFAGCLLALELVFKKFNLRAFNLAALGLFFGYLMGEALLLIFNTVIDASLIHVAPETSSLFKIAMFLFAAYFGMTLTVRASEELYFSIPFIKFKPTQQKKKDIIIENSILSDPRLVDLANSGLLDQQLIMPNFGLKELQAQAEGTDENIRAKARKGLETLKKLESLPGLDMRYADNDFSDIKEIQSKLARLARHLEANIITSEINKIQQSEMEGLKVININFLSHALKPITTAGEHMQIKIQRYGKEPRQGVGYLEDGTMVVVNGGAEFIGETIKALVLSVKHTSSGRMIFCNAVDDPSFTGDLDEEAMPQDLENSPRNYFAL